MSAEGGAILVVDDDATLRALLGRALRQRGHTIVEAEDGARAIELLGQLPFDLVLLDMVLPALPGDRLLAMLKADPALRHIPVIMISGDENLDQVARCIELGAEDYLVKPFDGVILHARVGASLEKKRQRDRERASSAEALRRETAILTSILDSMGDGVLVADRSGRLLRSNPAAARILGSLVDALLPAADPGAPLFFQPDGTTPWPVDRLPLARALRGAEVDSAELVVRQPDTPDRWLSVTARPLREADGTLAGGVAVFRDISAAKQAEAALRASEERYALAAQGANDGLWDWDLRAGRMFFSKRWKEMLGYADDEIGTGADEWFSRLHPDDREAVQVRLAAHARRLITHFELEYRIAHRSGSYRWMLCRGLAVWDDTGHATRMVGSQTDITDRKLAEERLIYDALHDALTGLPNRALFMDRLGLALKRVRRSEAAPFAVLFIDLDRFKTVNDSLGHAAGDELLVAFARCLERCLRPGDTIARLGGDEFAVLLDDLDDDADAGRVAERIRQALAEPLQVGGRDVYTTVSIGVALASLSYERPEELLRDADTAMYQAKLGGRARHMVFDAAMHDQALTLLQLETDLRRAIDRGELTVFYQPIVALVSGAIVGFEALARWWHPRRGLIGPAEFIPLAEDLGLVAAIDRRVLAEACRQLREWQRRFAYDPPLTINVNLSARQLMQAELPTQVAEVLRETGVPAECLKLEITESALIAQGDAVTATLSALKTLGVRVCIDDFGTGYSSLSYLHQLPIDTLKIDRSFISRLGSGREHGEIVKAIVSLARSLGMDAVAEGTETVEQADQLRALQCEYGQGWLFARALDPTSATELLEQARGA